MKNRVVFSIVSPIYNDMNTLSRVLPVLLSRVKSLQKQFEIVLLDDGSRDGSREWIAEYAKKFPTIVVRYHDTNQGVAKTYRELYALARGEYVVLFSLDGEWDPEDAVRLLTKCIKNGYDIVVGVRTKKQYSLWRMIVSFLYNQLNRMLFGVNTHDAGSIKVFRKHVLTLPIISRGVFDEAERLIRASRAGFRIGSLAISHAKTVKRHRGIRFMHVIEAMTDVWRVYGDVMLKLKK